MFKNLDIVVKKNLIWIVVILMITLWLKADLTNNSLFPIENAHITKSLLLFGYDNFSFSYDKFSSILPASFLGLGSMINPQLGGRIIATIFSFIQLYFFFLFSKELLKDKNFAVFSTLFLAMQAPIIFIGRIATSDIIAITFFTIFLWQFTKLFNKDFNANLKEQVLISIFFILSVLSNYLLVLFLPLAFILIFKHNKKNSLLFLGITILCLVSLFIFNYDFASSQISSLFKFSERPFLVTKLFVRIAEYIAIPIMIIFAATQILWKTNYKPNLIYFLVACSFVIPFYLIIFNDMYNIYRLMGISLLFLSPMAGLVIYKFLTMDANYKYATIFISFFIIGVSYWNITKLESAYFDTSSLNKYFETREFKKMNFYSEDPFLISSNFYPKVKEKNNLNLAILRKPELNPKELENVILNKIRNGELDYIVLNGLIHPELTERIKNKFLGAYQLVFSADIKVNTLMYPVSESIFEIYKVRDEFKIYRQFYAEF